MRSDRPNAPSVSSAVRSGWGRPARRSAVATFSRALSSGHRLSDWKTIATPLARWRRETGLVEVGEGPAVRRDVARGGLIERGCQGEKRALAATRGTDDRDQLAALDSEIEAAKRDRAGRARLVDLEDVVELERRPLDLLGGLLGLDVEARELVAAWLPSLVDSGGQLHLKLSMIFR